MPNYRYNILKTIASNGGEIYLDALMNELTKDIPESELTRQRNNIAVEILGMTYPESRYIRPVDFTLNTGLGKYFDQRKWVQDSDDEPGTDNKIIITDDGLEKLAALKELYDPAPNNKQGDTFNFNDKFEGNLNTGDVTGTLNQTSYKELLPKQIQEIVPTIAETKRGIMNSFGKFIIKHIWIILLGAIGSLLATYIAWKYHWFS